MRLPDIAYIYFLISWTKFGEIHRRQLADEGSSKEELGRAGFQVRVDQWYAEYFPNMTLQGSPAIVRLEGQSGISQNWSINPPAMHLPWISAMVGLARLRQRRVICR